MSGIIRDFSQKSVQQLRSIIQKNAQDSQFGLFDWFEDTFIMQELDIKNYLNNVNDYHAKMIDKHNMGSTEFDKILERVHSVDTNYASRFSSLGDRVTALYTRIERLTEMINPSVITTDPSDFAKLVDGISSNYNKVKVESNTKIKQFEASMPVLYDKQWYKNVADSVQSGLDTTGQVLEGMGWGGINLAKDILLTLKYLSDDLCNFINHDPLGQTKNFLNDVLNFPTYVLNGGLDQSISNQFNKFTSDCNNASTEKQSEMVIDVVGNVLLLGIPGSEITKFFKAGEAVEVASDVAKVEKGTEALKDIPKIEKGAKAAEAEKAANDFAGTLRGEEVKLKGVKIKEIEYVKRNPIELEGLRNEFNSTIRKNFLQGLSKNAESLREAGFSEKDILKLRNGRVPDGWQVHHKLSLDDSGTNNLNNLVLIQNEPYHKVITNYQNSFAKQLTMGDVQTVEWPIPEGDIYPPKH